MSIVQSLSSCCSLSLEVSILYLVFNRALLQIILKHINIIYSRSIHVVADGKILLFMAETNSIVGMYNIFFIQ